MCRLAAYLGAPATLGNMLLNSGQGELQDAQPGVVGLLEDAYSFGVGWYTPDATPAVYTQPIPAWLDSNLPHLSRSLSSGLWLVYAQNDISHQPLNRNAAQPLCDADYLFAHHGFIEDFSGTLRPEIRNFLNPDIEAQIHTNSVAEHLMAVMRNLLDDNERLPIEQALAEMFTLLEDWLEQGRAQLNIIITDGEGLYAARHAINMECAPLYYSTDDEAYPNAQLIATAPPTSSEFWQPVPENHILILSANAPAELVSL